MGGGGGNAPLSNYDIDIKISYMFKERSGVALPPNPAVTYTLKFHTCLRIVPSFSTIQIIVMTYLRSSMIDKRLNNCII